MRGKNHQLQIRVTAEQKAAIQRAATRARMDMSSWVLSRVLPSGRESFARLTRTIGSRPENLRYGLAELNDFLATQTRDALREAVAEAPAPLEPFAANYVAAMVETAVNAAGVPPPSWTERIPPLAEPVFGAPFAGLRFYLLLASPPAFRRRNIFIDASVGDRV
jgi:hypothetical protein